MLSEVQWHVVNGMEWVENKELPLKKLKYHLKMLPLILVKN